MDVGSDRPWSVVLAAILLLTYELSYIAAGVVAWIRWDWEELAGLVTLFALIAGFAGLVQLGLTVPTLNGSRWAWFFLTVISAPLVAYESQTALPNLLDGTPGQNGWEFWNLSLPLLVLIHLAGVLLLWVPPSWRFCVRHDART